MDQSATEYWQYMNPIIPSLAHQTVKKCSHMSGEDITCSMILRASHFFKISLQVPSPFNPLCSFWTSADFYLISFFHAPASTGINLWHPYYFGHGTCAVFALYMWDPDQLPSDVEPIRPVLSTDDGFDFVKHDGRFITEFYLVSKCCAILYLLYRVQMNSFTVTE
jgi:hypothetical protein